MIPFINIHTHKSSGDINVWELISLYEGFDQMDDHSSYSLGLHPWHIRKHDMQKQLHQLEIACEKSNVCALGECGLDKICSVDFDFQIQCFQQQIQLANRMKKPLIIHCVRAFQEVLEVLKKQRVSVPVIFHGFNKKKEWAARICESGYFLSFGKFLLHADGAQVFRDIPLNKVFLETDETDLNIQTVYQSAASIKKINIEALMQQVAENAGLVFDKRFLDNE